MGMQSTAVQSMGMGQMGCSGCEDHHAEALAQSKAAVQYHSTDSCCARVKLLLMLLWVLVYGITQSPYPCLLLSTPLILSCQIFNY